MFFKLDENTEGQYEDPGSQIIFRNQTAFLAISAQNLESQGFYKTQCTKKKNIRIPTTGGLVILALQ